MNVKQIRDYLNSLDLDNIQSDIEVVSVLDDGKTLKVDSFGNIILVCPDSPHLPYLAIYTEEAIDVCHSEEV